MYKGDHTANPVGFTPGFKARSASKFESMVLTEENNASANQHCRLGRPWGLVTSDLALCSSM